MTRRRWYNICLSATATRYLRSIECSLPLALKSVVRLSTILHQESWQILEPIDNQENADILQTDFNFSTNYQNYGLGNPLSYFLQEYGSQFPVNGMCGSISTASIATSFWKWETQTDPITYLVAIPEGLLLQIQSAIENQNISTGFSIEY